MALQGAAKAAWMREYMAPYMARRRLRLRLLRDFEEIDRQVLALAKAGYLNQEIAEALDITDRAVVAALGRVAEFLAPTPPPARSVVVIDECLPFVDERYRR